MISTRFSTAATALLLTFAASPSLVSTAQAQEGPPPPGVQHIKQRQATMTVLASQAGPLFGVAGGKIPYDATRAQLDAMRIQTLAGIASEMFPADSQSGAATKAKAAIWTDTAEFAADMKDLQDKAAALVTASKAGTLDALKPAVFELGKSCKGCHDKFQEK